MHNFTGTTARATPEPRNSPAELRSLVDSIGPNGIEIHIGAAELEPILGRLEKIGNRLVAVMIASALIGGIGQLTTKSDSRWRSLGGPLMSAGVGAASTLGAYLAVTAAPPSA